MEKKYINELPLFLPFINLIILPSPEQGVSLSDFIFAGVILSISLAIMILNKSNQPPIVKYNPILCILILLFFLPSLPTELSSSDFFINATLYSVVLLNIGLTFFNWKKSNV